MAISILRRDAPRRLRLYCTNETTVTFRLRFKLNGANEQWGKNLFYSFFFLSFYGFFNKYSQLWLLR